MATVFQSIPTDRQPGLKKKNNFNTLLLLLFSVFHKSKNRESLGLKSIFDPRATQRVTIIQYIEYVYSAGLETSVI